MAIEPELFRAVFRRWPSGVTVLTCREAATGRVRGMTVSSLTGVSLEPPMVSVCVHTQARMSCLIREELCFGVHVLGAAMQELSDRCAGFLGEEAHWLDDVECKAVASGAPILQSDGAWMDCRLLQHMEAGDHTMFLGLIEAAAPGALEPLLWYDGSYRELAEACSPQWGRDLLETPS